MLISVQTGSILDPFGIDEGFAMIAGAGFDGVDINLDHWLPTPNIREHKVGGFFDQSDEDMRKGADPYKRAAEKHGVRFLQAHAPFPNYTGNTKTDAYVLRAVEKTILLCGYLGCGNLVVHPGFLPDGERITPEQEWDYNIAMYSALIPALKEFDVVCCLENMFSKHRGKVMEAICSDPHEAIRYIDRLNEIAGERRFGFCLDTGHAMLLGKDLYTLIHQLGERIQVLHIHDNDGLDDEHLFPYMGIIDWERFCRALGEIGYAHDLSFETFRAMDLFDDALAPEMLRLLHATGELFVRRIAGDK